MIWTLGDARILDRLQPLLDLLDADAVALQLAGLDQLVEDARTPPACSRPPAAGSGAAAGRARRSAGRRGSSRPRRRGSPWCSSPAVLAPSAAGLGGDERPRAAARLQHLADDRLRAAAAIDVGGVDEGDAGVERGVQRRLRVGLARPSPQVPPIAQAPKPISETAAPSREARLSCMSSCPSDRVWVGQAVIDSAAGGRNTPIFAPPDRVATRRPVAFRVRADCRSVGVGFVACIWLLIPSMCHGDTDRARTLVLSRV